MRPRGVHLLEGDFPWKTRCLLLTGDLWLLKCQWDPGAWPGGRFYCLFLFSCFVAFLFGSFHTVLCGQHLAKDAKACLMRMLNSSHGRCVWQNGQRSLPNQGWQKSHCLYHLSFTLCSTGLEESSTLVIWGHVHRGCWCVCNSHLSGGTMSLMISVHKYSHYG